MSTQVRDSKLLAVLDVALFVLGLICVAQLRLSIGGDGQPRFDALSQLLTEGTLSSRTDYSLVGPIFAAPLWWLAGGDDDRVAYVARYNLLVFALGAVLSYFMLRKSLGPEATRRFLLILFFGTAFPHELQHFYGGVFSTVTLACGLLGLGLLQGATRGLSSLGIVLSVANTPAMLIGAGLGVARMIQKTLRLRWVLLLVLAAAMVMGENWLRHGALFTSTYAENAGAKTMLPYSGLPGFSYPLVLGVVSILFSFGKGLCFYYPGLFIPTRYGQTSRDLRIVQSAWYLALAGIILVYARWWAWYGGWCWGPRFFLFAAFPASLSLSLWVTQTRSWISTLASCFILAWSLWVGYCGLVFGTANMDLCLTDNYRLESLCWYMPEFSPLFRPFIVTRELVVWERNALYLFMFCYVRLSWQAWQFLLRCAEHGCRAAWSRIPASVRAFRF